MAVTQGKEAARAGLGAEFVDHPGGVIVSWQDIALDEVIYRAFGCVLVGPAKVALAGVRILDENKEAHVFLIG
jgi:hypothetical protein